MSDTAKRLIIFYETHLHSTYGVTNASPDSCPPHPCLQGAASGSNLGHFVKSKTGIDIYDVDAAAVVFDIEKSYVQTELNLIDFYLEFFGRKLKN